MDSRASTAPAWNRSAVGTVTATIPDLKLWNRYAKLSFWVLCDWVTTLSARLERCTATTASVIFSFVVNKIKAFNFHRGSNWFLYNSWIKVWIKSALHSCMFSQALKVGGSLILKCSAQQFVKWFLLGMYWTCGAQSWAFTAPTPSIVVMAS